MHSQTIEMATRLWEYMAAGREHAPCEAIVVCCSYDLRVADYACELFRRGIAPQLIITGNTGNWTKHLWSIPEAEVFRERVIANGVDPAAIRLETEATNFGENISCVRRLVPELRRAVFLTKPNSVLRVQLTLPVQWPEMQGMVDAPAIRFPDEVSNVVGILGVIDEMVGDVDRILRYPQHGYQTAHNLPAEIIAAWEYLKSQGFTNHLVR
ncbi:YdcF family protein [Lacipirellula sp.]|uniref:YdcF family protein n=1 Tax=Lacipirellula sp. TaxID=2691419 RepID=UPI003D0D13C6